MPILDIDMFDEDPKVGDKVKVMGKVKSIDEETGEVDISYDDVKIVDEKKRKKRRNRDNDNDDDDDVEIFVDDQTYPQDQSLDTALMRAFPNTQ